MSAAVEREPPTLAVVEAAVRARGLAPRGAFVCAAGDEVPAQPDGRESRTLVLIGNLGGDFWPVFQASSEARDGRPDPLNRWSQRVIDELAAAFGGLALYPFGGPPYRPFQRWAQRAEAVFVSPLGLLVHPDYGLWHAYRGAIALAQALALPPRDPRPSPCESCVDKPCLSCCPVAAFGPAGYDVPACTGHIVTAAGADCLDLGCRARRACPLGRAYHYPAAQARFHMEAFLTAQRFAAGRRR